MENIDVKAETFVPPEILSAPKEKRRKWLHAHINKMLTTFVLSEQSSEHEHIRNKVAESCMPKEPVVYNCSVCRKQYKYAKPKKNHEKRVHTDVNLRADDKVENKEEPSLPTEPPTQPDDKPRDDRYRYATLRLSMGMLLKNFDDAIKEGDGQRIIRCWKLAMLIFRAYIHSKYALAALQLQAYIQAMLIQREAECLVWNRTVNNKGGQGCNICMDIRMEHLIHLTKEILKHLGVNITENAARRCSMAIGHVDRLISAADKDLSVRKPSGHYKVKKRENDFRLLVKEFHERVKVFDNSPSPEREYHIFANFQDSLIRKLEMESLSKWITHHKKELHKMEPL